MIPNYIHVVERLAAEYPAEWANAHHGGPQTEAFVRRLAFTLNAMDPRIGLNGKRGDPNDISDDCVCVREPGQSIDARTGERVTVIDFIIGAGGPDPRPGWGEVYDPKVVPTLATWVKPPIVSGGGGKPVEPPKPPVPAKKPYPGDAYFVDAIGIPLEADYAEAGQSLGAGSATWFSRTIWDHVNEGLTLEQSITKHRAEWRAVLGLRD